ncbi:MFS transporter [Sphingosinicella terrae]|uniref:MFS transporter n=1 Tax=Sphingosinicella terrae TaxID=2172047 RepID=UPI0032D972B2
MATMMNFFDVAVFQLTAELIKRDFGLTDAQLGLLLGPAGIMFYLVVGIPLARLVDIYRRTTVLGCGLLVTSGMTAAGGVVQSYGQFFASRMFVGVGGSAHAPGTYSMLADYFPPKRLARAIAFLQLGFILGNGLGAILGGLMLGYVAGWDPTQFGPLVIRNWQWVLIAIGAPGMLLALCIFMIPEPPRRGKVSESKALPIRAVLSEIGARRRVYFPLFLGLALSALEAGGLAAWRAPFMMRTYGWTPEQIGAWSGLTFFVAMPVGVIFGTWLTERLSKRHRDAPVRTTAIVFAIAVPFSVLSPFMPTGELAIVFGSLAGVFGIAAAVPQNVAIQTVTPNEMRGQVTALYLFMFTVFGALGASFIPIVTGLVGGDANLWISMALVAGGLLPLAVWAISRGMRPYAEEVARLERISVTRAASAP